MDFSLRGSSYPITNSSDILLAKIQSAIVNNFIDAEDDEKVAYAIVKSCPSIPADLVSYQGRGQFNLWLDASEIIIFSLALSVTILERSKVSTQSDRKIVLEKIQIIKNQMAQVGEGLSPKQIQILSRQILSSDETGENKPETEVIPVSAISVIDKDDEISRLRLQLHQLEQS